MRITKCDICKKNISREPLTAGVGFFQKAELCNRCGAPILKFLKQHNFVEPKCDLWSLSGALKSKVSLTEAELKKARKSFAKTWPRTFDQSLLKKVSE